MSSSKIHNIGSRRELFLDNFLVESLRGGAVRRFHHPVRREVVLTMDGPNEFSNAPGYLCIVQDGKRHLLYYRTGGRVRPPGGRENTNFFLCVAETHDGKTFRRCPVGLLPESPHAVLNNAMTADIAPDPGYNFCPGVCEVFLDTNPACPKEERFKMLVSDETRGWEWDDEGGWMPNGGIFLFVSPDGFRFRRKSTTHFAIPGRPCYDSGNLAFWDPAIGAYRVYLRQYKKMYGAILRTIQTTTTPDFVHFQPLKTLRFNPAFQRLFADGQQLYTNNVLPYFRAPHIFLGLSVRYYDSEAYNETMLNLPAVELRAFRAGLSPRFASAVTETVLISSRDGLHFQGVGESFLRPGPNMEDANWIYGDTAFARGIIQTRSDQGHGAPDELSFYFVEGYGTAGTARIRRCTLRMDGFASIHFPAHGGTLLTKPLVFSGDRITLNISTGAFGNFKVALLTPEGDPIHGYTLEDALPSRGDGLALLPCWKGCIGDVRPLAGRPVRLLVEARDADLYSLQFVRAKGELVLPAPLKIDSSDCHWH